MNVHYKKYKSVMLKAIKKYRKTEKGKIARAKADKNFRKKNPEYMPTYFKKMQKKCRERNICLHCYKRKAVKGLKLCKICREKNRLNCMKHNLERRNHD